MKIILSRFWEKWQALGRKSGDLLGRIVMTFLYFTIVMPYGLVIRYFSDPLKLRQKEPTWEVYEPQSLTIEDSRRTY